MKIVFMQTLVAVTLLVIATMTKAEIYKCVDPSGKTTFTDQPCAKGQSAAATKQLASPALAEKAAPRIITSDYKSRPEYPECLQLRNRLSDYFSRSTYKKDPNNRGEMTVGEFMGGEKALAEVRKNMARYKEICGVVDKEGALDEEQKQALKDKPLRDAEAAELCAMMRQKVAELQSIKPLVASSVGKIITPEEVLSQQAYIAEAGREIPVLLKEIEKSCGKK